MNYFTELMRIAETLSTEDKRIVQSAAVKLIEQPKPVFKETKKIDGYGYLTIKSY